MREKGGKRSKEVDLGLAEPLALLMLRVRVKGKRDRLLHKDHQITDLNRCRMTTMTFYPMD